MEDARQNGAKIQRLPVDPRERVCYTVLELHSQAWLIHIRVLQHLCTIDPIICCLQTSEDWPTALEMLKEGTVHDFEISFVNRGGIRGVLAGIEGFMPFSKMCTGLNGVNAPQQYKSLMSTLPGLKLRVKVVQVSL